MKTLKDLKAAVAKATHMKLVHSNRPHKHLGVVRKIHHVNTVGFALTDPDSGEPSYMQWPKRHKVTFPGAFTARFRLEHCGMLYELITEASPCATS